MSIKDKLRGSQGSSSDYVKLPIVQIYKLKEVDKNPVFAVYDKEEKKDVFSKEPITGIYIGSAMKMSSFDDNIGKNGGQFFSSYYFNKEKIVLFKPGKTLEKAIVGNMDEVEAWIANNTTSGKPNKKRCFFILTAEGLIEVQTNLSISIDQEKKYKDALSEKYIILIPAQYSKTDKNVGLKTHEILGKLAIKNPPCYACISVGELITEEDFETWGADEVIETFTKWKEQNTKTPEKVVPQNEDAPQENDAPPPTEDDLTF